MIETSTDIAELAKALAEAQGEIKAAEKDRTNPHFGNKYATLDALWATVRGPLSSHGLSLVQGASSQPDGDTVSVTVTTMLLHTSGQWMRSPLTMWPKDASPQAIGSVLTYARRYSLAGMVGVTAEEDDDANTAQPAKMPARRFYANPGKSGKPVEQIGQPDQPASASTTAEEAAEAFPLEAEDRPFLLGRIRSHVQGFTAKEREVLKKQFLEGHMADMAPSPLLHKLYLFLGDPQAVADWRKQIAGGAA